MFYCINNRLIFNFYLPRSFPKKYLPFLQATFNGWITIMNSAVDSTGVSINNVKGQVE